MMDDIKERIKLMGSFGKQFLVMLAFMGTFLFFFQIRETMRTLENYKEIMVSEMQNKLQLANLYTDYYVDSIQGSLAGITIRDDLFLDRDRESYFALSDIKKNNGFSLRISVQSLTRYCKFFSISQTSPLAPLP